MVLTGNYDDDRGRHYWFDSSGVEDIGSGQIGPGIEWKSSRGYVLVPPSNHASGTQYELSRGSFESIPGMPEWLETAVTGPSSHVSNEARDSGVLTGLPISSFTLRAIESGLIEPKANQTQRESAVGVARNLREAGTQYELAVVLVRQALLHPDASLRPDDPWTDRDVRSIVDSVFAESAPDFIDHVEASSDRFKVQSLADAAATAESPTKWLVRDLLAGAEKAILAAPPKAKKTFLALHLARCVATGEPFLEQDVWPVDDPGAVLFVQEEHAPQQWAKRLVKVFEGAMDAPFYFMHRANIALTEDSHVSALIKRATEVEARLIVIDPWQRVTPGVNENDAGDTESSWRAIHRIAEQTGAVVLVIHHANKGDGELGMDMIRGSSRMAGEVDLILVGRKLGNGIELFVDGRDIENAILGTIEIAHDPDSPHRMRQAGIRIKAEPRNRTRSSLETVLRGADRPLTTSEVTAQVTEHQGKQATRQNVETHLKRLTGEGLVSKETRQDGRGTAEWKWTAE